MKETPNPELDLTITRVIRAPRQAVWDAWTNPESLAQWWIPEPAECRIETLDLRPGGGFETLMSEEGGPFEPHLNACFLDVREQERIVFSNALQAGWRPAANAFMTAIITFADHPNGTEYSALVMHKDGADRSMHEEMGFHDGWGTVAGQLADLVEGRVQG